MTAKVTFHRDWRDLISQKLRDKIGREQDRAPSRPYLGRSLDKFERFVPHLRQKTEVTFQLEDVCRLVNQPGDTERWSPNSASRFLHYLASIGIIEIRYAGRQGNGFRLLKNFSVAPDPSRQSGTGRIVRPEPEPEGDKGEETNTVIPSEEEKPMPAQASEETVELDGDAVLASIDQIAENLNAINLDFRTSLSGPHAAEVYAAENKISKAKADLHRLRTAVRRGDGTPLEAILNGE
jgi:hypothetical protein